MMKAKQRAQDSIANIRAMKHKKAVAFAQLPYEEQIRLKEARRNRNLKDLAGIIIWDYEHGMLNKTRKNYLLDIIVRRIEEIGVAALKADQLELSKLTKLRLELEQIKV